MKQKLSLKEENEALRETVERSFEMVNLLKAYCDNPRAYSQQQRKDLIELYDIYIIMLVKLGFKESEIILPN